MKRARLFCVVVGTLLGTEDNGVVSVCSCFPVPHTEVEDQMQAELCVNQLVCELGAYGAEQDKLLARLGEVKEAVKHMGLLGVEVDDKTKQWRADGNAFPTHVRVEGDGDATPAQQRFERRADAGSGKRSNCKVRHDAQIDCAPFWLSLIYHCRCYRSRR